MKKKAFLSPNKQGLGVCAGLADYLNIDVVLVRYAYVLATIYTGIIPGLIAYLIISAILPKPPQNYYDIVINTSKPFYKGTDVKLCGVCSAFGEYFDIDTTIIRVLVVVLSIFTSGFPIIAYIVGAIMFKDRPYDQNQRFNSNYDQNTNYYANNQNPNYNTNQNNKNTNNGFNSTSNNCFEGSSNENSDFTQQG